MKKITWCLLVLSLSLFSACLGGKTNARRESVAIPPTGSAGTNIVKFENAVVRCGFIEVSEGDFEVTCHTLIDRGGDEVLAGGIEVGLELEWLQPAGDVSCSEKRNGLTYRCRVLLLENQSTQLAFQLKLVKRNLSRFVSDEVVLPIEISTFGMPPQIPQLFKSLPEVVSQKEAGQLAGFQRRYLAPHNHHWFNPEGICHTEERMYFSSGSHVYAYEKSRASTGKPIWLFAGGTGEVESVAHPLLLRFSQTLHLDCNQEAVYVLDQGAGGRIVAISHQGAIKIHDFSRVGDVDLFKTGFNDINVTAGGEFYVTSGEGIYQVGNSRQGATLTELQLEGIQSQPEFGALVSDKLGILYVCDLKGRRVLKIGRPNALGIRSVSSIGNLQLTNPLGIAITPDGKLYVSIGAVGDETVVREAAKIWEFGPERPNGSRSSSVYWEARRDTFNTYGVEMRPRDLAFDGSKLYFLDASTIGMFEQGTEVVIAGRPQAIDERDVNVASFKGRISTVMASNGTVYVAEEHTIYEVAPLEAGKTRIVQTLAGGNPGYRNGVGTAAGFINISDIAVDSNGILYVTDTGNHRIRTINKNSMGRWWVSTIAGDGSEGVRPHEDALQGSIGNPRAIAVGQDGALYVATDRHVLKLSPPKENGTRSLEIIAGSGASGFRETELDDPMEAVFLALRGVAVGADDSVYVADMTKHRMARILPPDPVTGKRGFRSIRTELLPFDLSVGPSDQIFYIAKGVLYSTSFETAQSQVITRELPGQICGAGVLEETGSQSAIGERLSSSLAKVCQGSGHALFSENQCNPGQSKYKLILTQRFGLHYSNAIEISLPCPN